MASSGTLTFAPGEMGHAIAVSILDDAHDEGEETLVLHLRNAVGAELADAQATGKIANSDPMPRAWLGRFGRTAWDHVLGAVDERLRSARVSRTHARIGGRSIAAVRSEVGAGEEQRIAALAKWVAGGHHEPEPHAVSGRELLAGSEFQVTTAGSQGSEALTVWGQGAYGSFAGQDAELSVSGDVASGTLGVDYAAGPWLAGLALSHSTGWGSYSQPNASGGEVASSLTGAYPYVSLDVVPERLGLWLAGGYGLGGMRLAPLGGEPVETRIGLLAGAAGMRGVLVPAAASGGFALGVNADALLLRGTSEATAGPGCRDGRREPAAAGTRRVVRGSRRRGAGDAVARDCVAARRGRRGVRIRDRRWRRPELHPPRTGTGGRAARAHAGAARSGGGGRVGCKRLAGVGSESGFGVGPLRSR